MSTERIEIETKDGPIYGYIDEEMEFKSYKFKSIPYAKPPLGKGRFMPPIPVSPWKEPRDCTQDAPVPLSFVNKTTLGSEDCLYIEISTKQINPQKPLPVMFWIGTCAFVWLNDNCYDSSLLVNQGVVFVRCGFRLGPFGFLSLNDVTAPGNCGLKDITLALKWVQRNIHSFGGDPNNVTVFGNSSGGAIVHLLMLSPLVTGLFHKAIIQSASALNNWSLTKNPCNAVMDLAKCLAITETDKFEIVEKLRTIDCLDIMTALSTTHTDIGYNPSMIFDAIFKPCIEQEFEGQAAFLCKSPLSIIKSGKVNRVPIIIGSNNIEGSVFLNFIENLYTYEKFNADSSLFVPRSLVHDLKSTREIGMQLQKFYLGGDEFFSEDNKSQYLQMISDYYFTYYINQAVKLHSQLVPDAPIYYYILNQVGEWQVPEELEFFNSITGHGAELPFIFGIKGHDLKVCKGTKDSVTTRKKVTKLWTNFAKYGNPTPDDNDSVLDITWDPVESKDKLNYLSIGPELTKGRNPYRERMAFWDKLHHDYKFLRAIVHFNDIGVNI